MKKDAWYVEHKREEKRKRDRVRKIRDEIFSGKAEKLSSNIFKTLSGEIYKIMPRFGTKYQNSPIIRLDAKELDRHIKEDEKIKDLAKIMASN